MNQTLIKVITPIVCAAYVSLMTGCATDTTYGIGSVPTKDGGTRTTSVKTGSWQSDRIGDQEYTYNANGTLRSFSIKTPSVDNVPVKKVALTNAKGQLVTDKAGNAVFNEIPMVAQITPSTATTASWGGLNLFVRGLGSFAGTLLAGFTGIAAANAAGSTGSAAVTALAP